MVSVELNDRQIHLLLDLIEGKVHYGVEIDMTREYIKLFDILNAKKMP